LVATHYVLRAVEDMEDLDRYVVFVNTGVPVPGVLEYVREVADLYGWPLTVLSPDKSFEAYVLEKGMPTMRRRWCCYYLKLKPIVDFTKGLRPQRVEITGLRREESLRRRKMPEIYFAKRTWNWHYAPLIDWTDAQVASYLRKHNLWVNPLYKVLKHSGECLCGVYATMRELRILRRLYPEWFYQFVELESRFRSGRAAFYLHGKPVYAKDIWNEKYGELT